MTRQVQFKNNLSICTAGDMSNELLNALQVGQDVLVDLSGVTSIDCATLQVLVATMKEAGTSGVVVTWTISDAITACASSLGVALF